jgi:hypothetical protein
MGGTANTAYNTLLHGRDAGAALFVIEVALCDNSANCLMRRLWVPCETRQTQIGARSVARP